MRLVRLVCLLCMLHLAFGCLIIPALIAKKVIKWKVKKMLGIPTVSYGFGGKPSLDIGLGLAPGIINGVVGGVKLAGSAARATAGITSAVATGVGASVRAGANVVGRLKEIRQSRRNNQPAEPDRPAGVEQPDEPTTTPASDDESGTTSGSLMSNVIQMPIALFDNLRSKITGNCCGDGNEDKECCDNQRKQEEKQNDESND